MNVVSVMAHQDDELMCLGTMIKLKEMGHKLHFICLTDGSMGMVHMPDMSREEAAAVRHREMSQLAARLDATYTCLGVPDEFLFDSKEIRIALINALRATKADLIFTHFNTDYNLDHMITNQLVRQCAMHMPLPMIRTEAAPTETTPAVFLTEPFSGFEFEATHWVDITDVIEEKIALAKCHKSQDDAFIAAFGEGMGIDHWVKNTASRRGEQCGVKYAEAFRPMLSRGLVKPYSILP
ncbi:MAG: PIG-L family deacetylase [Clostridiales bacterium]|jgi:LmbE family N-acetylglucosaminyl deacetylase|nr:PIG-L family deacetylase [Clostridiales bacterium]